MAAGMGSRYGGLKQMDPVGPNGETIIEYSVRDAVNAGFGKLVFVIRRAFEEDFKKRMGEKFAGKIQLEYAFQELDTIPEGFSIPAGRKKPWGTGHAVMTAENCIDENFAVINADDFYGGHAFELLNTYLTQATADGGDGPDRYAMIGYVLRQTLSDFGAVARGVCLLDEKNHLKDITETVGIERDGQAARYPGEDGAPQSLTGDETVSMNVWGFTPSIFAHLREQFAEFLTEHCGEGHPTAAKVEFYLPSVVDRLIETGQSEVKVLATDSAWFGVTYREDLPHVQKRVAELIDRGVYKSNLWD